MSRFKDIRMMAKQKRSRRKKTDAKKLFTMRLSPWAIEVIEHFTGEPNTGGDSESIHRVFSVREFIEIQLCQVIVHRLRGIFPDSGLHPVPALHKSIFERWQTWLDFERNPDKYRVVSGNPEDGLYREHVFSGESDPKWIEWQARLRQNGGTDLVISLTPMEEGPANIPSRGEVLVLQASDRQFKTIGRSGEK